jgi:4-amino-4-deoxy-L-arabinose transferase-like glycosyltransferase
MNETIIILAMLIACIGILLYFVGWVNTIFMALGKDEKIMGVIIFLLSPIAIYYSIKHWDEAKVQAKQLTIGLIIMCATIIPAYVYYSNNIAS